MPAMQETMVIGKPAAEEAYRSPLPPVGLPVVWYERGTLNGNYHPATVLVTYASRGTVDLMVQRTRDGIPKAVLGVWHATNPALDKCPHDVKSSKGCWDYMPSAPGMRVDLNGTSTIEHLATVVSELAAEVAKLKGQPAPQATDDDQDDDVDRKILELAAQGKGTTEICSECHVNYQKVNAVLRKRGTV